MRVVEQLAADYGDGDGDRLEVLLAQASRDDELFDAGRARSGGLLSGNGKSREEHGRSGERSVRTQKRS